MLTTGGRPGNVAAGLSAIDVSVGRLERLRLSQSRKPNVHRDVWGGRPCFQSAAVVDLGCLADDPLLRLWSGVVASSGDVEDGAPAAAQPAVGPLAEASADLGV